MFPEVVPESGPGAVVREHAAPEVDPGHHGAAVDDLEVDVPDLAVEMLRQRSKPLEQRGAHRPQTVGKRYGIAVQGPEAGETVYQGDRSFGILPEPRPDRPHGDLHAVHDLACC